MNYSSDGPLSTPKAASMGQSTHHMYGKDVSNVKQQQGHASVRLHMRIVCSRDPPRPPLGDGSDRPLIARMHRHAHNITHAWVQSIKDLET